MVEKFFKAIGEQNLSPGREHWAVKICAQFECSGDAESSLRHAWKAMRYDHPQLACTAQEDTILYQVPDNSALDQWLAKTFIVVDFEGDVDALVELSKPSQLPTLTYCPHTSRIVLCASHWRIDGMGSLAFLNNLFKAFGSSREIKFGDEYVNLSPALETIRNFPLTPSEEDIKAATNLIMQFGGNLPSIGLQTLSEDKIPGETCSSRLSLSKKTTNAVVMRCKESGFSVTAAVHTSLIAVTGQLAAESSLATKYTSWGTFNVRHYLEPPYNRAASFPFANYLFGLPISLVPDTFSRNVKDMNAFYKQLSVPGGLAKLSPVLKPYFDQATAMLSQPLPPGMPPPTEPMLDSLGVLDSRLDGEYETGVKMTGFWLHPVNLLPQLIVYLWTWRGSLTFSISYNKSFHSKSMVDLFASSLRDKLLEDLGLESTLGAS